MQKKLKVPTIEDILASLTKKNENSKIKTKNKIYRSYY